MKYLIIALLLAGAAWAETTDWDIEIYGTADGFKVVYERDTYNTIVGPAQINRDNGILIIMEGDEFRDVSGTERYEFYVDSLADIRPTPAEMEEK